MTTASRLRLWPDLGLITVFWIYVALANMLWALNLAETVSKLGLKDVFSPWSSRLLQHLLLFLPLVGFLWVSRRIAWHPYWRAIPLQLLCALGFTMLANPAMDISESLMGNMPWQAVSAFGPASDTNGALSVRALSWLGSIAKAPIRDFLLPYLFCLALLGGLDVFRRYRDSQRHTEALKRSLDAAQLAALRMQLSPHALFNLLHTIRAQIAWNPELAQEMIVQLGDVLRKLLRAGQSDLLRLHDELDLVRLYLELQHMRFGDRLLVSPPAPETVPNVWVPSLILQPLVENAVVHGLADAQSTLEVRIHVRMLGEVLTLRVENSLSTGTPVASVEHIGIGLKNVRERLATQFGYQASLRAGLAPGNRWSAEIRLPVLHCLD